MVILTQSPPGEDLMKCKMVAIIFNVDHCFSPLFFHFPLLFFSLPPFLVLMGAEQNTGGTCRRANSWRQNEKHDRGDRMCNREAATKAVPADRVHLLIENFFFFNYLLELASVWQLRAYF